MPKRTHITPYRIAFSDCDPAKIVFFANYFKWFDTAGREFFTACGVPGWSETERTSGIIGNPLVSAQADFLAPATYGEDIEIESWVESWGKTSFVMEHIARRGETILARGREVRVFAIRIAENPPKIQAIPIPEAIRAACS